MVWIPNGTLEVISVATPFVSVPLPSCVDPSATKLTLPVGVPEPDVAATVAVNVTLVPGRTCAADVWTVVWVSVPTVSLRTEEVEVAKVKSPLYTAVIERRPDASVEVVKAATPALRVDVPIAVVPSRKLTVPVGVPVPEAGVTVAVKVTVPPMGIWAAEVASAV